MQWQTNGDKFLLINKNNNKMEETLKLAGEIDDLSCRILSEFSAYESWDIAIKILALQEQRKSKQLEKREYFALLALQGFLANPQDKKTCKQNILDSILIADTLIEELNKTQVL
jgi:hypothetical protein